VNEEERERERDCCVCVKAIFRRNLMKRNVKEKIRIE
jgi:hypothetical protein